MPERAEISWAIAVFAMVAISMAWLAGNRLVLVNDEGIYLDGAVRLLHGSLPYRDFFALTGPGTFWNLAVIFHLCGVSLAAARVLLIVDLGLICACMYWMIARFHARALALWTCALYIALLAADRGSLVVNHRWDSTACGMLGVSCFVHGFQSKRRWPLLVAGALGAYAACITPPIGLIAAVMLVWAVLRVQSGAWVTLAIGLATPSIIALVALAGSRSLTPLLNALMWTASQYSAANRFAYGAVIGGYAQLFEGACGVEWPFRTFLVLLVALPAILPLVGLGLYAASGTLRRSPVFFVAVCGAAAVAGCYPRMDTGHLIYAAPFWYVCTAVGIARLAPLRVQLSLVLLASVGASVFALSAVANRASLAPMSSRTGGLVGEPADVSFVRDLEASVQSREAFFAFPYLPIAYFLTSGTNPTRYSFLQPGMMSDADEQAALSALTRAPPAKVLYMRVRPSAYLRMFPSRDPTRLQMPHIEAWLDRCYKPSAAFSRAHPDYELLFWRGTPGTACSALPGYN